MANVCDDIKSRYQMFYRDEIVSEGICNEHRGLVCFGTRKNLGFHVWRQPDDLVCMSGSPTLEDGDAVRRLDARELAGLLFTASGTVDHDLVGRINPPFTLARLHGGEDWLTLVEDGLGFNKFFLCKSGDDIVFSNKCWPIFRILARTIEADWDSWRLWFAFGWFPRLSTPFNGVRALDCGEILRCSNDAVSHSFCNAVSRWLSASAEESRSELLSRAGRSFNGLIRVNAGRECGSDLTGGIDSRAVCSGIIKEGVRARFYTSGPRGSADVTAAGHIAARFNLEWTHVDPFAGGAAPPVMEQVLNKFTRMAIWDEGFVEPNRFDSVSQEPVSEMHESYLSGGISGISKGPYYSLTQLRKSTTGDESVVALRDRFVRHASKILPDDRPVIETFEQVITRGTALGLSGYSLVDYFYLDERVRRWASAHSSFNLLEREVQPFLNVDHITVAFALEPIERKQHFFQKYLITRNAPGLLDVSIPKSGVSAAQNSWLGFFRSHPGLLHDLSLRTGPEISNVLEPEKVEAKLAAFISGADDDLYFVLRLLAFRSWVSEYSGKRPN